MKKAFTLVETMIVLVIIGILSVALTQAYLTITRIAFKVEQERNLTEEALMLTQIFQSISETATIDYDAYSENKIDLSKTNGFTDILYLTGGQRTGVSIFSKNPESCLSTNGSEFLPDNDGMYSDPAEHLFAGSGCQLLLQQGETITPLIDTSKLVVSKVRFKVLPFDSEINYFYSDKYKNNILINDLAKPGYRIFLQLYSSYFQPVGLSNIKQPLQLFFNLNAPLPSIY